ncbi:ornithine carbamoyltransferase [Eggerthella sp. YY7918]|uniref:ornithine carbamoyltransferase n=1 Tax=Eggerthella sp. (strain YY7918) TaxID=502558 RepID=UPI00021710A5|nr:ornithine carbamoyltransferase [Eggerthella sp. YY7918]BAK43466.1 hypothetical protein EGYY_02300 [Eggerthella sp. YY7918]
MNNGLKGKDFISIADFSPEQLRYILDLAAELKSQKKSGVDLRRFNGKNAVAIFEWGSTRTRCAFETSCNDLGICFTYLTNSHMGEKETVKDSVRVLSAMYDMIIYRTLNSTDYLRDIAKIVDVPVIDALSGEDHPTQMLADALTMEEEWGGPGSCRGKKFAFVGNCAVDPLWYGRICALLGMDFYAIGPDIKMLKLCDEWRQEIKDFYAKWAPNNKFVETDDLDALKGVDAIATEWWQNSIVDDNGKPIVVDSYEAFMGKKNELFPYRVSNDLVARTDKETVVLHMLPACHNAEHNMAKMLLSEAPDEESREIIREGLEITDECFETHAHHIFREAENRQHTIRAVVAAVMGL